MLQLWKRSWYDCISSQPSPPPCLDSTVQGFSPPPLFGSSSQSSWSLCVFNKSLKIRIQCSIDAQLLKTSASRWYLGRLHSQYEPVITSKFSSRLEETRKLIPNVKLDWPTPPTKDPRAAYNSSKLALLIEARPIPHLSPLILHMITVVPPDWRFLFIGSRESIHSVSQAYSIKHQQVIGKLDLMQLPSPWSAASKEDVFRLLTDSRFYDEFLPGVEWVLKYEHDSILCANSETSLNDCLDWDWAGVSR